jgi:hypothetical protein
MGLADRDVGLYLQILPVTIQYMQSEAVGQEITHQLLPDKAEVAEELSQ